MLIKILAVLMLCGCSQPPSEAQSSEAVVTSARLSAVRVLELLPSLPSLALTPIGGDQIEGGRVTLGRSALELVETDAGRGVLSLMVACALPAEAVLVARAGGQDIEFFGELGVAGRWIRSPLDQRGREDVSACVMARASGRDVVSVVSLRGYNPRLRPSSDEAAIFVVEEGAFYGDLFEPGAFSLSACRGRGWTSLPIVGALTDRVCALPDPSNAGFTLCGFRFTGDCADVCAGQTARGAYYACKPSLSYFARALFRPVTAFVALD